MTPPWGINWQSYHKDQNDMPHVQRMGYKAFTLYEWMWSDAGFMAELLPVARPDAIFLCRDHPLSEQKDDLWKSDPAQKGRNHADEWAQKVQQGRVFTPLDRSYFLGINEPDSNHYQWQIDQYNEALCRRMAEHGLWVAAYSFGVGHPSTVGSRPDTLPDWTPYAASAAAVLEGGHIVAAHEYGAPEQGGYGWGYWCNRLEHCPYPFDVVLDECGIDNGVVNSGELYGWAKYMDGDAYLQWLDGFQVGQAERAHTRKARIIAYNIFSYDHGRGDSKDWHSFDIRPLRPQLEIYNWTEPTITITPQHTTHLPAIGTGDAAKPPVPPTAIEPTPQPTGIIAPRVARAILDIESGGRAFGNAGRVMARFEAHIFKARLGNDTLWAEHFRTDATRAWVDQMWRPGPGSPWRQIHTGLQDDEYNAFYFARTLHADAAYNSISMGAAQIMGFNHARIGYPTAQAMYDAFADADMQIIAFVNFLLSDPALIDAARRKDWRALAAGYNGSGNVDQYATLLEQAYNKAGA